MSVSSLNTYTLERNSLVPMQEMCGRYWGFHIAQYRIETISDGRKCCKTKEIMTIPRSKTRQLGFTLSLARFGNSGFIRKSGIKIEWLV